MEGGGGVERRRALVPRLAGPVLKQIPPTALPVATHGGARAEKRRGFLGFGGLGRRGMGWVGAAEPGSEVAGGWKGIGGGGERRGARWVGAV